MQQTEATCGRSLQLLQEGSDLILPRRRLRILPLLLALGLAAPLRPCKKCAERIQKNFFFLNIATTEKKKKKNQHGARFTSSPSRNKKRAGSRMPQPKGLHGSVTLPLYFALPKESVWAMCAVCARVTKTCAK